MNPGIYGFPGPHVWESPLQAIVAGETTFSLPIQRAPDIMDSRLVCIVADPAFFFGGFIPWQPGDLIEGTSCFVDDGVGGQAPAFGLGYSRCGDGGVGGGLTLRITTVGNIVAFSRYGTSFGVAITVADWQIKARAIWFDP